MLIAKCMIGGGLVITVRRHCEEMPYLFKHLGARLGSDSASPKQVVLICAVILLALTVVASGPLANLVGFEPLRILRFVTLASATVLATVLFGVLIRAIWELDEKSSAVKVAPFVVIDPSGDLKNAEAGLASLLVSRINDIESDMERSRRLLAKQAQSAGKVAPGAVYGSLASREPDPILANLFSDGDSEAKLELQIQGVDLTGIFAWIRRSLRDPQKAVTFTAYVDSESGVAIGGDIKALELTREETIWIPAQKQSPTEAIENLAYRLYQTALGQSDARVLDLDAVVFRNLMQAIAVFEDPSWLNRAPDRRRRDADDAYQKVVLALGNFEEWEGLSIVAGQAARLAGRPQDALSHYQGARAAAERRGDGDAVAAIAELIAAATGEIGARSLARAIETEPTDATRIVRKDVRALTKEELETLRAGFQAIGSAKGAGSLESFAKIFVDNSIHMSPLFLPWHRAFLAHVEKEIRKAVPGFSLACWSFDQLEIPQAYKDPTVEGGQANPLFEGKITRVIAGKETSGETIRNVDPEFDSRILVPDDLNQVNSWDVFSRMVETQYSNFRHGAVGGSMGTITDSAYDPLFYAHRCAVDRLWAEWQGTHGPESYAPGFLESKLEPFGLKVRDVLDTSKLGYVYAEAGNTQ